MSSTDIAYPLRPPYAMSSADIAYPLRAAYAMFSADITYPLRADYAMSSTDIAYPECAKCCCFPNLCAELSAGMRVQRAVLSVCR
eukprot:2356913-Rhodomonas_salina.1